MPFAPYAHQVEACQRSAGKDAFAYLMAMRTGKTKVTIDDWQRTTRIDRAPVLVVTAPAGSYRVWETELQKHLDPEVLERAVIRTWDSKVGPKSVADAVACRDPRRPRILIANVEAFSSVDAIRHACADVLQGTRDETELAADESTTIKNWDADRAKVLRVLRELATRTRILSGQPTPRSPLDLWGQFEFLKPGLLGFVSYKAFEQRYAVVRHMRVGGKYSIRVPVRYTEKIEELWEKLSPHSYRKRLEECADVPPKLYVTREVELTSEQARLYREMDEFATAELQGGLFMTAGQAVTRALRLHQLCCGWATDDDTGTVHQVATNRPQALMDLLEEHDGKAIIWCSYTRDLVKLAAMLERKHGPQGIAKFYGQNRKDREEDNRRFKTDHQCRYMLATPDSGGRGRDWSEASLIVFYSNRDNLEHRDQAEERASGVGKQDRVTIVDFATRGTVEWKIIHAMRKKIDLATTVLGDPPREWVV
jgi:SNF2 family DNA or RNA helicase